MADVWANSMVCHPRATCHIAGCKNSIRHIENRFRHILFFFVFNAVQALTPRNRATLRVVENLLSHLRSLKVNPHSGSSWPHTMRAAAKIDKVTDFAVIFLIIFYIPLKFHLLSRICSSKCTAVLDLLNHDHLMKCCLQSRCHNSTVTDVQLTLLLAKSISRTDRLFLNAQNQHFISYIELNFHWNWLRVLGIMQEYKRVQFSLRRIWFLFVHHSFMKITHVRLLWVSPGNNLSLRYDLPTASR